MSMCSTPPPQVQDPSPGSAPTKMGAPPTPSQARPESRLLGGSQTSPLTINTNYPANPNHV